MARYARLKELGFDTDDLELFEVGEVGTNFLDKLADGDAAEAERIQQQKNIRDHIYSFPSKELASEIFSKLQHPKGFTDECIAREQQKQQEHPNIENGNPNVCSPDPTTQPTVVAICSTNSAVSGASLQEQQHRGGGRGGASPSGRWVGRNIEERSGRWLPVGCESYHRENASSVHDAAIINSNAPSSGPQWTPSIQRGPYREREPSIDHQCRGPSYREREPSIDHQCRGPSYREREPSIDHQCRGPSYRERETSIDHQCQEPFLSRTSTKPHHHQAQEKQSCVLHSSCSDGRTCHRFSKESSHREGQVNSSIPGPEKRSLPSLMHPRLDAACGGSFTQERAPTFQRSNSAREAPGLQRSSSTKSSHRSEMSIENWGEHPGSRSAQVPERTKHRVSFSLTEKHELETQKLREKFREPTAPCKKVLQAKQQTTDQQPLRYNYEQPGFVEREKENICTGKAYTIYGVKEVKENTNGSSARHHQVVRAFSLRENGSNYTKMPRAYSVNASGRHVMPMECDTCGKGGIGIVFLGVPGNEAGFCKVCKSSSSCGESKPSKKKKSLIDYCRKILRLPQKSR